MRRIFIILVLLWLAFVIYNYLNPEGWSTIISKVEQTWDSVFSKKTILEEPLLTWDTLTWAVSTWAITLDLFWESTGDITSWDLAETDEWLKELESEIKTMISDGSWEEALVVTWNQQATTACSVAWIITNTELGWTPCCSWLSEFVAPQWIWLSVDPWSLCYDAKKWIPTCKHNWTTQEWWYQIDTLLFLDNCDATIVKTAPVAAPVVVPPRKSPSSEYKDTQNIFETFFQ